MTDICATQPRPIVKRDGHYVCACCGAQAKEASAVAHDDCCTWGNTVEATLEFVPKDFLLGVEKDELSTMLIECIHKIGTSTYNDIDALTLQLTLDSEPETRASAALALGLYAPSLFKLFTYVADNPKAGDPLRKSLRNYVCFIIASRSELEVAADALNHALARHDTVSELFSDTLNKAYSIPKYVL